jgi:hypothetical protein
MSQLDRPIDRTDRVLSPSLTVRETEAEAVAFVVCRAAGLECSTRSSDYIQLYAGDKEVLLESLEHIQKTASLITSRQPRTLIHEKSSWERSAVS